MRNTEVVERWLSGRKGTSGNGNLRTDGRKLFSYKIVIGTTEKRGKTLYDFRGPYKIGLATTRHVCWAIRVGGGQVLLALPTVTDLESLRSKVVSKTPKTAAG